MVSGASTQNIISGSLECAILKYIYFTYTFTYTLIFYTIMCRTYEATSKPYPMAWLVESDVLIILLIERVIISLVSYTAELEVNNYRTY